MSDLKWLGLYKDEAMWLRRLLELANPETEKEYGTIDDLKHSLDNLLLLYPARAKKPRRKP